ncbi:kinase-associated protein B [Scopulibacillus darangshiensis]|uniref:Kinase-associated protein B n=1 Tax=Scopulibacillus darangshiensis TaxID=442528 RepID=A0A4R2NZ87_9BACL|nr:sporulation phosphorelay system protein KapB [Scopulibacillus darangshiensis]TCP27058.1 kinase-associated protein B [Scopulibacillus darangshiensis]
MTETIQPNDLVIARYKTGEYIAKVIEPRQTEQAVVEILAVIKHPTQGDLHSPNNINVPLFHQRKALAYHEKAVVRVNTLKQYEGNQIPEYKASLRKAVNDKLEKLGKRGDDWARLAIEQLRDLEKDYFG